MVKPRGYRTSRSLSHALRDMSTETLKIFFVVLTYWTISISLVFANKFLVGSKTSEYDVSLFVAWIQCIVTVVFIGIIKLTKTCIRKDKSALSVDLSGVVNKKIMTLTFTYVGMLTFNNLCLRNVEVAFYQVARSLTLIFVVVLSLVLLKKSVSWRVWVCCLTVAGGFILGVDQENLAGTLSVSGVGFGIITSLFVSLNGIFTKKALDVVDRNSVNLTLLNNINAVILFIPFVVFTGQLKTVLAVTQFQTLLFWLFLIATGVLAFAIAWISAVQIDLTSPLTHHISANSKAVLQTVIAVLWSGDSKPALWWISVLLVVGGACGYAIVRIREESNENATKAKSMTLEVVESVDSDSKERLLPTHSQNGNVKAM